MALQTEAGPLGEDVLGRSENRDQERLIGELRQLLGVRRLRVRLFGEDDGQVARLDLMIRERREWLRSQRADAPSVV
jgi:hypothetical protein